MDYLNLIVPVCMAFYEISSYIYNKYKSKKDPIIIAIEGNIGVGKTTLLDILRESIKIGKKAAFVSEPVDIWLKMQDENGKNILGKFYEDKKRWAYSLQNLSYITKARRLADTIMSSGKKIIFSDRSIGTDKNVFAKMLFDDGDLNKLEYSMYILWSDFYDKYFAKTNKKNIIYLKCDPNKAMERIQKRGRQEEKTIPFAYLNRLHEYHEQWIGSEIKKGTHVLVLDWNDDLTNEQILKNINNKINKFIADC